VKSCLSVSFLAIVLVRPVTSEQLTGAVLLIVTGAIGVDCDLCRLFTAASGRDCLVLTLWFG
jgi:hypothetical protein